MYFCDNYGAMDAFIKILTSARFFLDLSSKSVMASTGLGSVEFHQRATVRTIRRG